MTVLVAATTEQISIIGCRARFLAHIAGRRCGKTIGVCRPRIIRRCLSEPRFRYTYIAPSYAQLWEEYVSLRGHESLRRHIVGHRDQPFPHIAFKSGSQVGYRSFERPDNIRSKGEDEVWCDEIQDFLERDFWPVIRPLISDRRGALGISGQLRGRNWVWHQLVMPGLLSRAMQEGCQLATSVTEWVNAACYDGMPVVTVEDVEQARPIVAKAQIGTYASWVVPSWKGLMFSDDAGRAEIELARSQLPRAVFDQEYGCVPNANQASVFRPDDLLVSMRGELQERPTPGLRYVIGLDLGRIKDPTSVVVLEASQRMLVHERVFPLGSRHEDNAREVRRLCDIYGSATVICDTTGGATGGHAAPDEYTKFYAAAMPDLRRFHWSPRTKRELIEALAIAIEQHKIAIPRAAKQTHSQLAAYEYRARGLDGIEYGAPSGEHDDLVAALAMANYAIDRGWIQPSGSGVGIGAFL